MNFICNLSAPSDNCAFSYAQLLYDKEYFVYIELYPKRINLPHIFFNISIERSEFITKQPVNLSYDEKVWLNEYMKKKWPVICSQIKRYSGKNVSFSRPDYTQLPDFYNNDIMWDYDGFHIHRFEIPDIGLCEIMVRPYKEYPVFYIEKIPSRELVSIISMLEPIYMAKNCIRLNKVQKKALVEEMSKNAMAWGEWDSRMSVWDSIKLSWNSGEFEPIFDVTTTPDYTKLPE